MANTLLLTKNTEKTIFTFGTESKHVKTRKKVRLQWYILYAMAKICMVCHAPSKRRHVPIPAFQICLLIQTQLFCVVIVMSAQCPWVVSLDRPGAVGVGGARPGAGRGRRRAAPAQGADRSRRRRSGCSAIQTCRWRALLSLTRVEDSVADPCHFGVDPDPDPHLLLFDPDPGGQKHVDPVDPDPEPDPQHWVEDRG